MPHTLGAVRADPSGDPIFTWIRPQTSVGACPLLRLDARTAHAIGVKRLLESYQAVPPAASVRLAKQTSNLFRGRASQTPGAWTHPA